jgi:protein-tyrosine-phosphatase
MSKDQSNPQGGSADFFEAMDRQVNGAIIDDDQPIKQATPNAGMGPERTTPNKTAVDPQESAVDWEKRYKDSSREAVKMRETLNDLKPFVPVLEAMKRDSGLVDHVRGYLVNGGEPSKNITSQLGLDDDFVYDADEAVKNPESDSAKVFNAHVDGAVQKRVQGILEGEKKQATMARAKQAQMEEIVKFKEKHGMTDDEVKSIIANAKENRLTLEDLYFLQNKNKTNANVANATKEDMMNQMRNVRNIPTSAGGVNSPRADKSADDQIFDSIAGSEADFDELFG